MIFLAFDFKFLVSPLSGLVVWMKPSYQKTLLWWTWCTGVFQSGWFFLSVNQSIFCRILEHGKSLDSGFRLWEVGLNFYVCFLNPCFLNAHVSTCNQLSIMWWKEVPFPGMMWSASQIYWVSLFAKVAPSASFREFCRLHKEFSDLTGNYIQEALHR